MAKLLLSLLLVGAMCCDLMAPTHAITHIVGGRFGWDVPPNTTFYQHWARRRTFGVGDKLMFMYRTDAHNVVQVTRLEFRSCSQNNPINMYSEGPTVVKLTTPGNYYYYSGVGIQCEAGQKLGIRVTNKPGTYGTP